MFHKSFLIISIFLFSFNLAAQTHTAVIEDEPVFILVGYRAFFPGENPENVPAEKQKEVRDELIANVQRRISAIQTTLSEWEKNTSYSPFMYLIPEGKISTDLYFKTETQVHMVVTPSVFIGPKSKLSSALKLNYQEVEGGQFKVEEIKDNTYVLQTLFGFYEKDKKEVQPYWTSMNKKEIPFPYLPLSIQDKEKTLANIIAIYKASEEYKRPGRHLAKNDCIYLGHMDFSWAKEEFIPGDHYFKGFIQEVGNGRLQMIIGISENIQEL